MARSKTPVTREEVGVEVSRGNRGRGGWRPPTASYRKEKEKEKVDVKGKGKIAGNRAKNLQLHDEGSNIDTRRRKDRVVARGEDEAHASESSSSDSSAPTNTSSTDRNVGGSTSGGGGHNEGESKGGVEMRAPFPGGPLDGALLKSFKDHVVLAIWSNDERPVIKCINHGAQIQKWCLQSCHPDTEGLQRIIQRSGLNTLIDCSYCKANKEVISAFVEQWQPETNTFHLPFGEMLYINTNPFYFHQRNRRALDAALRWMDLPPELCTLESTRKLASDIVNFLSGRSIGPTTTTTTTPTTATGTTDTSTPTEAGPRQSQHDNTSTHSTTANAPSASVDAHPPKRMHGKEYQRKNLKKPKL